MISATAEAEVSEEKNLISLSITFAVKKGNFLKKLFCWLNFKIRGGLFTIASTLVLVVSLSPPL